MCFKLIIHDTNCETRRIVHLKRHPNSDIPQFDMYHPFEEPGRCKHYVDPTVRTPGGLSKPCEQHGTCCQVYSKDVCDQMVHQGYFACMGFSQSAHFIRTQAVLKNQHKSFSDTAGHASAVQIQNQPEVFAALKHYLDIGVEVRRLLTRLGLEYLEDDDGFIDEVIEQADPDLAQRWEDASDGWHRAASTFRDLSRDRVDEEENRICYERSVTPYWMESFRFAPPLDINEDDSQESVVENNAHGADGENPHDGHCQERDGREEEEYDDQSQHPAPNAARSQGHEVDDRGYYEDKTVYYNDDRDYDEDDRDYYDGENGYYDNESELETIIEVSDEDEAQKTQKPEHTEQTVEQTQKDISDEDHFSVSVYKHTLRKSPEALAQSTLEANSSLPPSRRSSRQRPEAREQSFDLEEHDSSSGHAVAAAGCGGEPPNGDDGSDHDEREVIIVDSDSDNSSDSGSNSSDDNDGHDNTGETSHLASVADSSGSVGRVCLRNSFTVDPGADRQLLGTYTSQASAPELIHDISVKEPEECQLPEDERFVTPPPRDNSWGDNPLAGESRKENQSLSPHTQDHESHSPQDESLSSSSNKENEAPNDDGNLPENGHHQPPSAPHLHPTANLLWPIEPLNLDAGPPLSPPPSPSGGYVAGSDDGHVDGQLPSSPENVIGASQPLEDPFIDHEGSAEEEQDMQPDGEPMDLDNDAAGNSQDSDDSSNGNHPDQPILISSSSSSDNDAEDEESTDEEERPPPRRRIRINLYRGIHVAFRPINWNPPLPSTPSAAIQDNLISPGGTRYPHMYVRQWEGEDHHLVDAPEPSGGDAPDVRDDQNQDQPGNFADPDDLPDYETPVEEEPLSLASFSPTVNGVLGSSPNQPQDEIPDVVTPPRPEAVARETARNSSSSHDGQDSEDDDRDGKIPLNIGAYRVYVPVLEMPPNPRMSGIKRKACAIDQDDKWPEPTHGKFPKLSREFSTPRSKLGVLSGTSMSSSSSEESKDEGDDSSEYKSDESSTQGAGRATSSSEPRGTKRKASFTDDDDEPLSPLPREWKIRKLSIELRKMGSPFVEKRRRFY